jgi:predicted transglutaminase-like cysteine proteinase
LLTKHGIINKRIAKCVLKDVYSCFVYASREKQWTSHADSVEAGEVFKDDCDGFALTCAELLRRRGVPKSEVSLVVCNTTSGGDHLVCGLAANGSTWILDCNEHHIYDWVDSGYQWKYIMNLDYRGIWRNVKNA